jgi:hypothetical protein
MLTLEGFILGKSLREEPLIELPDVVIPEAIELPDVEIPDEKHFETLQYEKDLFDELLSTLNRIQDEASLVEEELKSIQEANVNDSEDTEIDDAISINTECTDACRELVNSSEVPTDHQFDCKACLKAKARAIKAERKKKDKQRLKHAKEMKEKQKNLLQVEQQEIATRLKSLRCGLNTVDILAETKKRLSGEFSNLESEYYN